MDVVKTVEAFDKFLAKRKLAFEAVVIGGAALNLLGIVIRETRDCDILNPKIPNEIQMAADEFRKLDPDLDPKWFNNGPDSLKKNLPVGWENRTKVMFKGKALLFHTLGREDLLKTKLFAYCDRAIDLKDCLALKPTKEELIQAIDWVKYQDANTNWPEHVQARLEELAKSLGYEL